MKETKQNLLRVSEKNEVTHDDRGVPLFIVLVTITNTLCWLPLFITCGMVVAGFQLHPSVINTIVGIAMPLNSLLNPCLYTFGTKQFREELKTLIVKKNK